MSNHTATILVSDDQPDLLELIGMTLESAGHRVVLAANGMEALEVLQTQPVDLIVADIGMPRINGYQLFQRVRERPEWITIPFIFLTARGMDSDIRYGKELGVDDYLTKPIQPEDLLATVSGKLHRARQLARHLPAPPAAQAHTVDQGMMALGRLRIDVRQHRVVMDDATVLLSPKEFTLLHYLAEREGSPVAPMDLIQATHDFATDNDEAGTLLRPLIRSLRRKLGYAVGETGCIENVRGVGYRLIAPE